MKGMWLLFKEEEAAKQAFLECSLHRHVATGRSSAADGELRKKLIRMVTFWTSSIQ